MLTIYPETVNEYAKRFCHEFIHSNRPKFVLGTNEFAKSISDYVKINGFIDDFTLDNSFNGLPVVKTFHVPDNSLVVSSLIGKPLMGKKHLDKFQFESLDYFGFIKYSNLPLKPVLFWDNFSADWEINRSKYESIYDRLIDDISRQQYEHIINFRLSYDLNYMSIFSNREEFQYFEDFLTYSDSEEVFVDVGGYDGYTSKEFARHCPNYKAIHIFEPEEKNFIVAQKNLAHLANVTFHKKGLSDRKATLYFKPDGSSSKISESGSVVIEVEPLDDIITDKVTFIKMDIEGTEREAIAGARETIKKYHPKLAISVYHQANDLWYIPEQILGIRDDYDLYLRHYTEGIAETIMFFIPKK